MHALGLPSDAFRLGDLTVVPSLNRLVRAGREVDVEPRVMRVLATLAETPGEVVSRADLFDAVWSDAVVNDEALTRAVSELRKLLGDDAPGAVETIRGTGYRLAFPAVPLAPSGPSLETDAVASGTLPAAPRSPLVGVAIGLAVVALAVALWAAWPRALPTAPGAPEAGPADTLRLDADSEYYRPGMSELGVYYDSTRDIYFRFVPDDE